jgi:hypothetical protein
METANDTSHTTIDRDTQGWQGSHGRVLHSLVANDHLHLTSRALIQTQSQLAQHLLVLHGKTDV